MAAHIRLKDVIRGYQRWGGDYLERGFSPFMLSFMFRPLGGSEAGQKLQMERAITAFYSSTLTRVVRNPSREQMPAWILLADFPVYKHDKISKRAAFQNDGLHVQGWAMLPPVNRLGGSCYADLLMGHHRGRGLLDRIECVHVKPITETLDVAVSYLLKSLTRHRATFDDVIILPRSYSEVG